MTYPHLVSGSDGRSRFQDLAAPGHATRVVSADDWFGIIILL